MTHRFVVLPIQSNLTRRTKHEPDKRGNKLFMKRYSAGQAKQFLYFDSNFIDICPKAHNWTLVSTGSDKGLAPKLPQAITGDIDPILWRMNELSGPNMYLIWQRCLRKLYILLWKTYNAVQ